MSDKRRNTHLIEIATEIALAIAIFILLLIVDPTVALTIFAALASVFATIHFLRRLFLTHLGDERIKSNNLRFKTCLDVFTGIKSIKVFGTEDYFLSRFEGASKRFSDIEPKLQLILHSPRYLIETIAFFAIIFAIVVAGRNATLLDAMPVLSVYALAAYRLLPSLNRAFIALGRLRHALPVLDEIIRDGAINRPQSDQFAKSNSKAATQINFNHSLALSKIEFAYKDTNEFKIKNLSIEIKKQSKVAFVGTTGSGKSTVIDLIIGLIEPQKGEIIIDGSQTLKSSNVKAWQNRIGYVPQDVFLYDATIAENIAFGIARESIDMKRVQQSAQLATIDQFISQDLPERYETSVGERGVRISGGQRQRIGIARALYRRPQILVLDEATSALDGATEKQLMQNIESELSNTTIIMIAHRLASIKSCDTIYLFDQGTLIRSGTHSQLQSTCEEYRNLDHSTIESP